MLAGVRTLHFGDGLYGEAGAMRIPEVHHLTRHHIKELGLSLRRFVNNSLSRRECCARWLVGIGMNTGGVVEATLFSCLVSIRLYISTLIAPEGRIFFAGEHASLDHSWIQGVLKSSLRVVKSMLLAAQ